MWFDNPDLPRAKMMGKLLVETFTEQRSLMNEDGLAQVTRVRWHPLSRAHFGVLVGNEFRMLDVSTNEPTVESRVEVGAARSRSSNRRGRTGR